MGVDPDVCNDDGLTALHQVKIIGHLSDFKIGEWLFFNSFEKISVFCLFTIDAFVNIVNFVVKLN